jgi:hypothetical protein
MNYYEINEDEVTRWYKDGKLHREDGPAVEYPNGYCEWYINGNIYRISRWNSRMVVEWKTLSER